MSYFLRRLLRNRRRRFRMDTVKIPSVGSTTLVVNHVDYKVDWACMHFVPISGAAFRLVSLARFTPFERG